MAQDNEQSSEAERPKIGLCLSGGGARGMAHIGVLKVIDEVGLPIDYITGVSMGSIVGGLYAMGFSADSICQLFKEQDWEVLLNDFVTEDNINIDEKQRYNNYLFEIGYRNKKMEFPTGLLPGQHISTMMSTICWDSYYIQDFDSLPIPYMAVAADLVSCRAYPMNKGYLPDAMRASMAIPTIFTPIDKDSVLLVDGGLVRNFAVDEAIEMGADIIIGSYTGRRLFEKEELDNSIPNMLAQISSFAGLFDAEEQKQKVDILIQPEYQDISPGDFAAVNLIIDRGYREALKYKDVLQALADSLNAIAPASPKKKLKHQEKIRIDSIQIIGNESYPDYQILRIMLLKKGYVVSAKSLATKMDALFATNYFSTVNYQILLENNKHILIIKCKEKASTSLKGSLHYDNYLQAGINLHASTRNFIFNRSRFTLDSYLSELYRFRFNYLKYLGMNQNFAYFINAYTAKDKIPSYYETMNERAQSFRVGVNYVNTGFQFVFNTNNKFELATEYQWLSYKPETYNPLLFNSLRIQNLKTFLRFTHNNLNNKHFPTRGWQWEIDVYANRPIKIIEKTDVMTNNFTTNGNYRFDWTLNSRTRFKKMQYLSPVFSLELQLNAAVSSDKYFNPNDFTLLGGSELHNSWAIPMSGIPTHQIVTKNVFGGGIGLQAKITENIYIGNLNYFYSISNRIDAQYHFLYGTEFNIGFNTRVGPVKFHVQHGDYFNQNKIKNLVLYFSMGYLL
jgi:NTE family protein